MVPEWSTSNSRKTQTKKAEETRRWAKKREEAWKDSSRSPETPFCDPPTLQHRGAEWEKTGQSSESQQVTRSSKRNVICRGDQRYGYPSVVGERVLVSGTLTHFTHHTGGKFSTPYSLSLSNSWNEVHNVGDSPTHPSPWVQTTRGLVASIWRSGVPHTDLLDTTVTAGRLWPFDPPPPPATSLDDRPWTTNGQEYGGVYFPWKLWRTFSTNVNVD